MFFLTSMLVSILSAILNCGTAELQTLTVTVQVHIMAEKLCAFGIPFTEAEPELNRVTQENSQGQPRSS